MKLINIGFGSMVNSSRIVAVVNPDSAPVKRIAQEAKEKGCAVDATYGRKTKSVIITDTAHVILSAIPTETIANRLNEENTEE